MWNDTVKKSIEHMKEGRSSWNPSVIRKRSCPLSVQINGSWFSPNWSIKTCLITTVSHKKHLIMDKSKVLPQDLYNLIVAKHTDAVGYRRISKVLNVPMSTVGAKIQMWKSFHHKLATTRCSSQDFWQRSEESEELSKSKRPLVERFRKTWN